MGHAAYSLWEDQTADRVVKRSGQSRLDGCGMADRHTFMCSRGHRLTGSRELRGNGVDLFIRSRGKETRAEWIAQQK